MVELSFNEFSSNIFVNTALFGKLCSKLGVLLPMQMVLTDYNFSPSTGEEQVQSTDFAHGGCPLAARHRHAGSQARGTNAALGTLSAWKRAAQNQSRVKRRRFFHGKFENGTFCAGGRSRSRVNSRPHLDVTPQSAFYHVDLQQTEGSVPQSWQFFV